MSGTDLDLDLVIESVVRMLGPGADRSSVERAAAGLSPSIDHVHPPVSDHAFAAVIDDAIGVARVVVCVDPIVDGRPVDVMLGAHHLLVNRTLGVRLVITGPESPKGAHTAERFIVSAHLDTVWRTPVLTIAQRNALLDRAAALVALTDAPSTWVAVRDALSKGIPVIVRDVGALSLLVDRAALVLPADAGPAVLAVAMERVLRDEGLRHQLARRGRARTLDTPTLDAVPALLLAVHESSAA